MGHVLYVGFATHRRATVKIRLYFKRLMFMQMICIKKNREKKRKGSHRKWYRAISSRDVGKWTSRNELESRENKRAVGNFKSFKKDRRLK